MNQATKWAELATDLASFGAVAALAVLLGLCVWPFRSRRWLPIPRLRPGAWSGVDVALILLWFFYLPGIAVNAVEHFGLFRMVRDFAPTIHEFSVERQLIWCAPLNFFLIMAMSSFALYMAHRTRWHDLGLSRTRFAGNVLLGCAGFLIVTLPVHLVFVLLSFLFEVKPHLLQSAAKLDLIPVEWFLLALAALVIAPIQEEWLFRGVLQGWLRRASALGHCLFIGFTLMIGLASSITVKGDLDMRAAEDDRDAAIQWEDVEIHWPRAACVGVMIGVYAAGVWIIWRPVRKHGIGCFLPESARHDISIAAIKGQDLFFLDINKLPLRGETWERWQYRNAQWAVVGASVLFAIVHMSNWPAPIPLFFLSLALGWLALRTQNLVPSIVLHALFNLVALLSLFVTTP